MVETVDKVTKAQSRLIWEAPALKRVGTIGEVLQAGTGKVSVSTADSGDVRKPRGQH